MDDKRKWRILIIHLLLCDIFLTVATSKTKNKAPEFEATCTTGFLWRALLAAGYGGEETMRVLYPGIYLLGFTPNGIKKKSIAAAWQRRMAATEDESKALFSQLQSMGTKHSFDPGCRLADSNCWLITLSSHEEHIIRQRLHRDGIITKSGFRHDQLSRQKRDSDDSEASAYRKKIENLIRRFEASKRKGQPEDVLEKHQLKLRRLLTRVFRARFEDYFKSYPLGHLQEVGLAGDGSDNLSRKKRSESVTKKTKRKKKRKNHNRQFDHPKILLNMMHVLLDKGLCQKPSEAFTEAFNKVWLAHSMIKDGYDRIIIDTKTGN